MINHLFNSTFNWLSTWPGGPISDLVEGALVLVRRSLFLSPEGVTAIQVGNSLTIGVNTGSVAYFRQDGTALQVSGDPGFRGAETFDAASISIVTLANSPGNAGCAGLVVDSGTIAGDLLTSQIDAIRFDSGAAFTKSVTATVTGGPLTLRNAVRGLTGVTLNAPVVLASDVEVDAGNGGAQFGGTVDATKKGKQSLTVTALGATTFDATVGAATPLASLLTRGIAPISIPQNSGTKTIPLYYMPEYSTTGPAQVKYGIDVSIGSSAPRTFVFDTGGNGFFAGYNPDYWNGATLTDEAVDITYTSGNYYQSVVADAVVTIGPAGGPQVSTGQPVQIGAILQGGNNSTGQVFDFTDPYAPPVDGRFAGDFGAAFGVQPSDNGQTGLSSVLFQLPGNLHTGFLVQLGPIGTDPSLTVGITEALRDQFPYAIPVAALSGGGSYPVSGYQVLQQFGFSPQYQVVSKDQPPKSYALGTETFPQCATQCLPSLIDSGAPSTSVRLPGAPTPYPLSDDRNSALKPGSTFVAQFPTTQGRPALTWSFQAGTNGSVNAVGYDDKSGAATTTQNVNTGLNLYNGYDVMFDTEKQVIWLRPNGGQSTVSLQSVTTTGNQSFEQNTTLDGTYTSSKGDISVGGVTTLLGDTVVNAGSGDVTFAGTVDGRRALDVNSGGATTFVRTVGGLTALNTVTTDSGGSTSSAGVVTTGNQSYGDDVTLNGLYTVGNGTFTVNGATTLAGLVSVQTVGGDITFDGTIDGLKGQGFSLGLSTDGRQTHLNGKVGSVNPLGGIGMVNSLEGNAAAANPAKVTAADTVTLNGSLGYAGAIGLFIGDNVTADFRHGGTIEQFTTSGVVFQGRSTNSKINDFTVANNVYDGIQVAAAGGTATYDYAGASITGNKIFGNSAFGIETVAAVTGLEISGNTIGKSGTSNPWNYVSAGPNTHGIVLAPGDYKGNGKSTTISDNTITENTRSAIYAPGGVQNLTISGNTLNNNGSHGIEFADGDFSGTTIEGNTIKFNAGNGISLGAGIGQGTRTGGNPLDGYTTDNGRYIDGHYVLPYVKPAPDFYAKDRFPGDPQIAMKIGDSTPVVNLDTGSRGLYFDKFQLDANVLDEGARLGKGSVYLNSSNRLYFGDWVQLPVKFTDSYYQKANGDTDVDRKAVAEVPVLVVQAIGASTTPPPGQTTADTTFGTTVDTGYITTTNGVTQLQAPIVPDSQNPGKGIVTIKGGYWAYYSDNTYDDNGVTKSKLASVANFGVGFDRSGQGTAPTNNQTNQAYNAFLNLDEMQKGSMRPGYVITTTGVTLGLDSTIAGFAYTDLAPTGLRRGTQSAPDWQPATGTVTVETKKDTTTFGTGPLVLDMGYPGGILTLPAQRYLPPGVFSDGTLTVNLLNSKGAVRYDATPNPLTPGGEIDRTNLLSPVAIDLFNPLAGTYSQNTPPLSQQFFNTGREAFAGLDYLYDAAAGYLGLAKGSSPDAVKAFDSAKGILDPNYYKNENAPAGLMNLTIEGNVIADNGDPENPSDGVYVNGADTVGIDIRGNSIYGNTGKGITLADGANGGQKTPIIDSAKIVGSDLQVTVRVPSGSGSYVYQAFASPASAADNVQGQTYLGKFVGTSGDSGQVDASKVQAGDRITVTVTPTAGSANTSEFSVAWIV